MTPLPPLLGRGEIRFWRLDAARHAAGWDSGEGAFRVGGRWNIPGTRAVYAALDPATAVLEVAVHKGVQVLDTQPHVLTSAEVIDPSRIHVVMPQDLPNPHWLAPGSPSRNQQAFGSGLLSRHRFVLVASAVSRHNWTLIFDGAGPTGDYGRIGAERFSLDPRPRA